VHAILSDRFYNLAVSCFGAEAASVKAVLLGMRILDAICGALLRDDLDKLRPVTTPLCPLLCRLAVPRS
jgi:hypothetical protein